MTTFVVVCSGCGAEARGLNLVGLFETPSLCPECIQLPVGRGRMMMVDDGNGCLMAGEPAHRGEPNTVREHDDALTKRARGNHPEFCLMIHGKHRARP